MHCHTRAVAIALPVQNLCRLILALAVSTARDVAEPLCAAQIPLVISLAGTAAVERHASHYTVHMSAVQSLDSPPQLYFISYPPTLEHTHTGRRLCFPEHWLVYACCVLISYILLVSISLTEALLLHSSLPHYGRLSTRCRPCICLLRTDC